LTPAHNKPDQVGKSENIKIELICTNAIIRIIRIGAIILICSGANNGAPDPPEAPLPLETKKAASTLAAQVNFNAGLPI
jgi:hypothetical protein